MFKASKDLRKNLLLRKTNQRKNRYPNLQLNKKLTVFNPRKDSKTSLSFKRFKYSLKVPEEKLMNLLKKIKEKVNVNMKTRTQIHWNAHLNQQF